MRVRVGVRVRVRVSVRRDDRDLRRRDALEPHVHVRGHDVLGLGQVLDVVRQRRALPNAVRVDDVDELEGVREARHRELEALVGGDATQVAQPRVPG